MAIDRARLEELRAGRERGDLSDAEAEELDDLQAASEKRHSSDPSAPGDGEGFRHPRFRPTPPQ